MFNIKQKPSFIEWFMVTQLYLDLRDHALSTDVIVGNELHYFVQMKFLMKEMEIVDLFYGKIIQILNAVIFAPEN